MQFQLRTLLMMVTAAAVVCGTIVAPPILAVPFLCLILWTSPAVWLSGVYYNRGRRQAFFLGGALAGIAPYMAAVILSIAYYAEWIDDGDLPNILERVDDPFGTLRVAVAVYLPGMCSLVGGALAMLAYEYQKRTADLAPSPASAETKMEPNGPESSEPLTR